MRYVADIRIEADSESIFQMSGLMEQYASEIEQKHKDELNDIYVKLVMEVGHYNEDGVEVEK